MKILISEGFGVGWSTWEPSDRVAEYMLTYQPLIEAIEHGDWVDLSAALEQLREDVEAKFGRHLPDFTLSVAGRGLTVVDVDGYYRVEEYDGAERVITLDDMRYAEDLVGR